MESKDELTFFQFLGGAKGDRSELEPMLNILRTGNMLYRELDQHLRIHGLSAIKFGILCLLKRNGERGVPLSDIGRNLVVSKQNITGVIDRLEREGLVERHAPASDRRVRIARLTDKGVQLLAGIMPNYQKKVSAIMRSLEREDREELTRLLTQLRAAIVANQNKYNDTNDGDDEDRAL